MEQEKLHATNHYLYYPDEKNVPPYLAYGFRPIFLVFAPYVLISMVLWGLVWSGAINIPFMNDTLTWHIYEMLFGLITAGTLAFLATGLPELFPGLIPLIGKKLKYIVILWVLGRISFWFIDITGIYLTAVLNLGMLGWIIWFARHAVLDRLQRHASIGYASLALFFIEVWFFASKLGFVNTDSFAILKIATGAIVVLILLALRRVNMEAINELMEDKGIDDVFLSRPPKTNLAIFSVIVFTIVEFLYPNNSALGWIGLASGAAILGITSEYKLEEKFILNQPYVIYLGFIYILLALGYFLMGWDILNPNIDALNHFRHFITAGGIGLSYVVIMLIITWIHTGRHLTSNIYTHLMVALIIIATFMRGLVPFYEEYASELYLYSSIIWSIPFAIYIKEFFKFLLAPRADGIKG
ncbi:NnrS family protein [Sulfurimonas lithotrophica]|uniref:NnrS family protein n=1 Tax=Sulfurimonas lithotrophica TaxID=2590022 RepID=A0A5P8P315_9BACT|nr:NnrS family protein [Sulfurimonas lithotrophica]QFR49977.1 NnrS family protein [Sulfurimonas lithotrophica]